MNRLLDRFEIGDKAFGRILLIAFLVFLTHKPLLQYVDDRTTPQPWFVTSFVIPDHPADEEPIVTYERSINRELHGLWSTRVQMKSGIGDYTYTCSGSGYAYYQPETSGEITMPLARFIGVKCDLRPGDYRACTQYDLQDRRGTRRSFGPFCSNFSVLD